MRLRQDDSLLVPAVAIGRGAYIPLQRACLMVRGGPSATREEHNEGVAASTAAAAPPTMALSMVVATFSGQGVFAHRWYPTMMIVREGDTVDLAVANPDEL